MKPDFILAQLSSRSAAEAEDAVKWAYQSAFGCGHALADEATCEQGIRLEAARFKPDETEPAYEPLGNSLCRLNLRSPLVRQIPALRIARMMRVTAEQFQPSPKHYAALLTMLRTLAAHYGADVLAEASAPQLPFTLKQLNVAIHQQQDEGGLPSHSEAYRAAYRPAYRVVLRRYGEALPALCALENQLKTYGIATLAIDGDCAAGKTTLSELLAPLYDCNVFHMDDFFLPPELRTPARFAQAGGNVHFERFLSQVLYGLLSGGSFGYKAFNCHSGSAKFVSVQPKPVTLIEGSYSLHPAFHDAYTALNAVRVLMTLPREEQRLRILRRNGPELWPRFENEWIPLEIRYFEAYHNSREDCLTLPGCTLPEDEPEEDELP
jgi:hypothetical protein